MIQPKRLSGTPGNIARYYTVGDYYSKGQDEPSEWGGKLAIDLGLEGPVDPKTFQELLAGQVREQQLGRHRGDGTIQHHPGWDFAVNAPKSVSIMALVAGDERVLAAHERAVGAAIDYLEEHALLRRREEKEIIHETTGRILVARFTEHGSRELDPHLHTHVVVLNMTNRTDGEQMASLESRAMYEEQRVAGQVYRNALAFELREVGHELDVNPRTGLFEIRGVHPSLIEIYSQRAREIEQHARENGLVGQKAQRASFYATRPPKVKTGRDELVAQWRERAGAQLEPLDRLLGETREREGPLPGPTAQEAARAALFGLRQAETSEAVNNRGEIFREGLAAHVGEIRLDHIRPRIEQHEERLKLLTAREETGEQAFTRGRTTRKSARLELSFTQHLALAINDARPIASSDRLLAVLETAGLKSEQERALVDSATSRDRVTGIHGVGGSGKSTLVRFLNAAAEPGTTLIALAPTSSAAAGLGEKAGIESMTVARLTAKGGFGITDRHVLVVDEAGQLGNRQARRLLEISRKTGARLLLLGDEKQTGAIEQGKPFWLMQRLGMPTAQLVETVRQQNDFMTAAVTFAREGNYRKSVAALNSVTTGKDGPELAESLVKAWTQLGSNARAETSILVLDNATRLIVNSKIREVMKTEGALAAEEARLEVLTPAGFTEQERHMARFYSAGQVVRFTQDVAGAGIARDNEYRVEGLGRDTSGRPVVRLVDENGRIVRWDPRTTAARHINVFNREERDLAEGDRIQWRLVNEPLKLRNAERGTVEKLEGSIATVRWDRGGRVQRVDLDEHKTWDHGYAETVYSAQSKTYPMVFALAPVESPLVNGQNYYTTITRAEFGVRLWTNDRNGLIEKLEQRSGEKTSSLEGLGRIGADRVSSFAARAGDRLDELREEQERERTAARDKALGRQLDRRERDRAPRGPAEHLAENARSIAEILDRFLSGILDRARSDGDQQQPGQSRAAPTPEHVSRAPQGPER
ncbi:DNA relaxase [Sphingobium sp. LB126]|uniref:MobF family relaxase n=1 Tax=Sphingobium sp. LB126 TaxID=1983755 RepID=UPI000C20BB96|nr:MobF family relaxase [Sphingobium sp. LB126]PJG47192.1 DNA relaxase [Sphingobium sp. LB126]